tara:strand:- start:155 stop:775 length:621 start_codon:yes stop_codon:yes gene_type:complete
MTYTEAYAHIDNLLDKTGTAYFIDTEKNQFLDLAVLEYTKGLINTLESDAQSMEKIAPLIVKSQSLAQSSGVITLPVDTAAAGDVPELFSVYHILRAYTAINNYSINIMSYNEYNAVKNNPFNKPDTKNPIGLLRAGSMDIIGNTENVYLEYIKIPENTHTAGENLGGYGVNSGEEIVNIAVRKMMLSLEDPRYQLQMNELTADKR